MKRLIMITGVMVLLTIWLQGQEPRFYISSDKIFTPGEEASVTVESRYIDYVDLRVYRIDDPLAFFESQANAHQPIEVNQYAGTNVLKIFRNITNRDTNRWKRFLRRFFNSKLRAEILENHEEVKGIGIPNYKEAIHSQVKILSHYPLLHHFRHTFSYVDTWAYEKIPINESTPGVYLVEAVNYEHVGYTLVVISNLALITKQSGDSMLCYLVDKISGQPIKNASVTILNTQSQKQVASGKTGKDGIVVNSLKGLSQTTVIAQKGKQIAIIDPTFFPVSVNHQKVYIYTDRPVYRPSQEVFYKGIARNYTDESYKTIMNLPVIVRVMDPKGNQLVEQRTALNKLGTFSGSFKLGPEPVIGTYKLIAELQGKTHQGEFKIKEYKKPRFKVDILLEGSGLDGSKVKATVSGKYYFGTPVQEATVSYFIYRTRFYIPWWLDEDYSWYYSETEYRSTREELVGKGEGELDSEGRFYFDFDAKADDREYTYRVEARVKDKSNFTVVGQNSLKTSLGQYSIGIRSQKLVYSAKDTVTVTFYTHDLNNRPIPAGFGFRVIKLSPLNKDGSQVKETVIFNKQLNTGQSGRVEVSFPVKETGQISLVAQGVDEFDHVIRSSTTIWVAGPGEPVSYSGEGIEIIADRLSYTSGSVASLLVLSRTPDIPFLFTVEGGNLYHHRVHQFSGNACLIRLPLKKNYTPNIHVQATTIFDDHVFQKSKTLIIPPVETLLKVSLETDKEVYRPGDEVTVDVQVKDYRDRPVQVELSLGVVDEAIYAISPELAVEFQKFFYPRKRNNVRTSNSLTFNFYGYSQDIKRELAGLEMRPDSGLSSFKGSSKQSLRQLFKDTCFWTPAVMTSKKGQVTIRFRLPDNITQWRLTARAVNWYTQLGSATDTFISRRDLTIEFDPPASLTEGDQITLPVQLKNITSNQMTGSFNFKVEGGEINDSFDHSVVLKPMGTKEIPVNITITGKEKVTLIAEANAGEASDSIKLDIPVLPYGVEKIIPLTALVAPEEHKKTINFDLPEVAYANYYRGELYLHSGVYRAVLSSLNYLAEYPYGCAEQTMSGLLPDIVLAGVLEKHQVSNPELKKKVDRFISGGISRLIGFQKDSGGWGWWNENKEDPYMTVYVMYGLTLAKNLGYRIADEPYQKGIAVLERLIGSEIPTDVGVLCLYVLTLADKAPVSLIMEGVEHRDSLSPYTLGLLALCLEKVGKVKEAQLITESLISTAITEDGVKTVHWEGNVQYQLISQNAPIETTAIVLQALLKIQPDCPQIMPAVHWLMNQRTGERWESTRDTATVVLTLSEFLAQKGLDAKKADPLRFRVNDGQWQEVSPEIVFSDDGYCAIPLPLELLRKGNNILEIEKNNRNELFVSLMLSYFSKEKDTKTRSGPLQINRQYYRITPNDYELDTESIDEDDLTFNTGEEFLVQLEIQPSEQYEYMVLEDYIPAGFQIIDNVRGYSFSTVEVNETLEHRQVAFKEVRDNRMVFFFNRLDSGEKITVSYLLRAALVGDYRVNPAVIRSMYYNNRRALSQRVEVKVK